MPEQRSSPRPPAAPARLPSRVTFRLGGVEYVGEGINRLEAFAVAVEKCAPQLRAALRAKREREARG